MSRIQPVRILSNNNVDRPLLSKTTRWILWATLCFNLANVGTSSGIMSPSGKYMKAELGMMDLEFGCFSAVYVIGRMSGAILITFLINAVNRKYLMAGAAFVKVLTLVPFQWVTDGYALLYIRVISGICHIFPVIYGPIWINQFCIQKSKFVMTSIMGMCNPFSRAWGFLFEYYFGSENWKWGMHLNALFIGLCGFVYMWIPNIYFSSKLVAVSMKENQEVLRSSDVRIVSIFNIRQSEIGERDMNFCTKYSVIFTNPIYIFCLIARVVILAINGVFTFWIPNYVTDVIKYGNKMHRTFCYCFMIVCGPAIGSFIGSYLIAYTGGYEKKSALLVILGFNIFATIVLTPITFMNQWYTFLLCAFGFQIFGSAVIPSLNQIILNTIPQNLRAKGFAIANVISTFFGGVPSPVVYGLINDKWKEYDNRMPMKFFTWLQYFGLLCVIIATVCRYQMKESDKNEPFQKKEEVIKPKADFNAMDPVQIGAHIEQGDDEGRELEEKP